MASYPPMHVSLDSIADSIGLTTQEKSRLAELEGIVETHLEAFLAVGRALAEIRSRRLYRQDFATWQDYCARRWGFSYSHANELVRSTETAEGLLASCAGPQGDSPLPPDLSPDALRPLQKLDAPLQSAVWRLASRVTEHPTHHVVSKIVRVVENAITEGNGGAHQKSKTTPPSEKKIFWLSLLRLSESQVPTCVVIRGVDEVTARKHLRACQNLIVRIHDLIHLLKQEFPSL
jgi:hypothetical protein